jgi:hypothetical protein
LAHSTKEAIYFTYHFEGGVLTPPFLFVGNGFIFDHKHYLTTLENNQITATDLRLEASLFYAVLADGREIGVPYSWFWRLEQATLEQRKNWRLIGGGTGIHWEDIDEDISVAGMLKGKPQNPARAPKSMVTA